MTVFLRVLTCVDPYVSICHVCAAFSTLSDCMACITGLVRNMSRKPGVSVTVAWECTNGKILLNLTGAKRREWMGMGKWDYY